MAECLFRTITISGIAQVVIGMLSIVLGAVEDVVYRGGNVIQVPASASSSIAIWAGIWILITGILGICAIRCGTLKTMIDYYMVFSGFGGVFAMLMIMMYAWNIIRVLLATAHESINLIMIILSICEFGVAIWAAVCCCLILRGDHNLQLAPTGTVVYTQTQGPPAGYIIVQGPDGTPVAIPAQTSGPMTEPRGIPVNNPAYPAAVPPHYLSGFEESQSYENPAKVAL